jgi:O6-methylguanine-DNA--protein-cysteine methyltransferase
VVDAKGGIGGFMGAGPDGPGSAIKRWLLEHERTLSSLYVLDLLDLRS